MRTITQDDDPVEGQAWFPVQAAVLPAIQIGPIRAEFKRCIVQDLSTLERNLGVRIDAVVGLDVLGAESFAVNYESRKIIFGAIEPLPFSVPFETTLPKLTVQLRLSDGPLQLLLDTGAQDVCYSAAACTIELAN